MRDASRCWASFPIRLPFVYDLSDENDVFHFYMPQLNLFDDVEPFSVAST